MQVLGQFSYFDFLEPCLFTSHFEDWFNLLRQPIPWEPIGKALLSYAAYIVGLTLRVSPCRPGVSSAGRASCRSHQPLSHTPARR